MNYLIKITSSSNLYCFNKEKIFRCSIEKEELSLIFSLLKSLMSNC